MVKIPIKFPKVGTYPAVKATLATERHFKLPTPIPWVESYLNILYLEIAEALILDLNHASQTLMGAFAEHLLRLALYEKKTGRRLWKDLYYDDEAWDKLTKLALGKLLEKAKDQDIIPEIHRNWWEEFKNNIRNPYAHGRVISTLSGVYNPLTDEPLSTDYMGGDKVWVLRTELSERVFETFKELSRNSQGLLHHIGWDEQETYDNVEDRLRKYYVTFFDGGWTLDDIAPVRAEEDQGIDWID